MTTSKSLFIIANLLITTVLLGSTVVAQGGASNLVSPNGKFRVAVTDNGISIFGPNAKINLGASNITIDGPSTRIDLTPASINIEAANLVKVNGAIVQVNGTVQLNGGCKAVNLGQGFVTVGGPGTYPVQGQTQSSRIFGC